MHGMTVWARDPTMRPQDNRPELSPHYQQSKDNFNNGINFCDICGDGACSCNKYIVHMYASTCELISKLSHTNEGPINLSMHHFFNYREMIFFLDRFTQDSSIYANWCVNLYKNYIFSHNLYGYLVKKLYLVRVEFYNELNKSHFQHLMEI